MIQKNPKMAFSMQILIAFALAFVAYTQYIKKKVMQELLVAIVLFSGIYLLVCYIQCWQKAHSAPEKPRRMSKLEIFLHILVSLFILYYGFLLSYNRKLPMAYHSVIGGIASILFLFAILRLNPSIPPKKLVKKSVTPSPVSASTLRTEQWTPVAEMQVVDANGLGCPRA